MNHNTSTDFLKHFSCHGESSWIGQKLPKSAGLSLSICLFRDVHQRPLGAPFLRLSGMLFWQSSSCKGGGGCFLLDSLASFLYPNFLCLIFIESYVELS